MENQVPVLVAKALQFTDGSDVIETFWGGAVAPGQYEKASELVERVNVFGGEMTNVTGTFTIDPPGPEIVTVARYVPGANPAPFTDAPRWAGRLPLVGLTLNHTPPLTKTE